MAAAATSTFGQFLVTLGNGATPTEVFAAPCGFTEKGLTLTAETRQSTVPDCDNPDAPAWTESDIVSRSAAINGSGLLAKQSTKAWSDFYFSNDAKNCKVTLPGLAADGGGTYTGKFRLTSFEITGTLGEKNQVSVALESTGPITFTAAV